MPLLMPMVLAHLLLNSCIYDYQPLGDVQCAITSSAKSLMCKVSVCVAYSESLNVVFIVHQHCKYMYACTCTYIYSGLYVT